MEAGTLRHRLTIQDQAKSRDGFGGEIINWTTWATVWGAVEPLSGRERFVQASDQQIYELTTRIRIRYREGLHTEMRVVWGVRVYNIRAVINRETRDREVYLMCEELNPAPETDEQ